MLRKCGSSPLQQNPPLITSLQFSLLPYFSMDNARYLYKKCKFVTNMRGICLKGMRAESNITKGVTDENVGVRVID
jgi:hypothetical protein